MAKTVKEFFDRMIVPQPNSPFGAPSARGVGTSRSPRPGGAMSAGGGISGTIAIRGADDLAKALDSLGPALEKKILRKAMRDAAKPILDEAKRRCPVDTGALRKSLKIRSIKRNTNGRVGVVVSTDKGFFKGDTFYGSFIEFGMPSRGIPAKPFIRPAFEANKARAVQIVGESIKNGLDDIVQGHGLLSNLRDKRPELFLPGASDVDYESGAARGGYQ